MDIDAPQPAPWIDAPRVRSCLHDPAGGPRLVFFSGGSALRALAAHLPRFTHRSVHLITPFDSGGSSAEIRRAFDLPAVGDCRNRLLALSNGRDSDRGRLRRLLARRLPAGDTAEALRARLRDLASGAAFVREGVSAHRAAPVQADLQHVLARLPADFDLRRASVGNLALAGAALRARDGLPGALARYEHLLGTRGAVRPVSCDSLHLAAELVDGRQVLGQHRLTGKEAPAPDAPIHHVRLSRSLTRFEPAQAAATPEILRRLRAADLIVYAPGSFYTSLLAALQPTGLAQTIAACAAPKVYVPSAGVDPEMRGLTLADAVGRLLEALRQHAPHLPAERLLTHVLIDPAAHAPLGPLPAHGAALAGAVVHVARLAARADRGQLAPRPLAAALVSLAR